MNPKNIFLVLAILLLGLFLSGCQAPEQATIRPTTEIPVQNTPLPPSDTPEPTNPPGPVPSNTPILPTPTFTAQPEQRVKSIEELIGVWKGYWSDRTMILLEFKADKQSIQSMEPNRFAGSEWYDFKDELLTWGKMIKSFNAPQKCIDSPEATYEVYITFRGDQAEKLRFVLVGEDQCADRQEFLNGNTLTWEATGAP